MLAGSFCAFASDAISEKSESLSTYVSAPVEVGNKICPVMNNPVPEGAEVKVEYEGKIYNLCCAGCIEEFLNNPEKYIKIVKDELAEEK